MLFLILLSSCIPFAAAAYEHSQAELEKIHQTWLEEDTVKYLLGDCDAAFMNISIYKTLGIPYEHYNLSNYEISDPRFDVIGSFLLKYPDLTFREKLDMAKKELPELTNEINHFAAVSVKEILVYMNNIKSQSEQNMYFISKDYFKVTISKAEAVYLLNKFGETIDDLILNFGSETTESFQPKIELFEGSKILNLTCNSNCVHKKYNQWMERCTEEIRLSSEK